MLETFQNATSANSIIMEPAGRCIVTNATERITLPNSVELIHARIVSQMKTTTIATTLTTTPMMRPVAPAIGVEELVTSGAIALGITIEEQKDQKWS